MGLFMSGIGSIFFALGLMVIAVIMAAIYIAIFAGLAALIVGGSSMAPALVFALLFTVGKSDSFVISVIIFGVSFYAIKKLMRFKKVEKAIMVHLAVVVAALSTQSLKIAISFLFDRTPAWILLVLMVGIMIVMLSSIVEEDHQEEKKGYPTITRIIASLLYGSAFTSFVGLLPVVFGMKISGVFSVVLNVLWPVSSIAAYILDIKLSENEEMIKIMKQVPVGKILKKYYDRYAKYILSRVAKLNKHE